MITLQTLPPQQRLDDLASIPLFQSLDTATLAALSQSAQWFHLPGGGILFRQHDPADCLYVVVHGRLQVIVEHADGTQEIVAQAARGECIGEMAVLTGERRFATVRALRDCELIRISGEECRRIFARSSRAMLQLTQLLVNRLRDTTAGRRPSRGVSTIAIVPASTRGAAPSFAFSSGERSVHAHVARELAAALARQGHRVLHLNRQTLEHHLGAGVADAAYDYPLNHRALQWLGEQEEHYDHVIFECDDAPSAWSERCLRQADVVMFAAAADADPAPGVHELRLRDGAMGFADTPRELMLVGAPRETARWLGDSRRFTRHHHVGQRDAAGYDRVARLVTGRAHALVLGGGGARGFAHLGALRAFEEARIPIDIIGGTSMGAIVGAQYAMGYNLDRMIELNRRSFVHARPISDYTIPLVSLIAGHRMSRTLKKMFGEARIEDQWLPYFCVATNLSRATVAVHRQGSLAFAVGTSIAVPGLAPPLIQDGDFLVDGGLLENVPVGVMRRVSQGRVFTVDVSKRIEFTTTRKPYAALSGWRVLRERIGRLARIGRRASAPSMPSMYKLLWRATVLNSVHRSEEVRRLSDVYIHPHLDDIDIFEWKEFDRAIEAGYRATVEALTNAPAHAAGAASQACEPDAAALEPDESRSFAVSKSPAPSNCHAVGSETMLRSPRSAICET
jgi:predicted acylesterase/phospholipase RssA/CRP-like cAMP-binding protein